MFQCHTAWVVWWYGSRYFCIFCHTAAGLTDCGWGTCCLLVHFLNPCRNLTSQTSLMLSRLAPMGRLESPSAEPSCPGPCANNASLWYSQSECFLLLLWKGWWESGIFSSWWDQNPERTVRMECAVILHLIYSVNMWNVLIRSHSLFQVLEVNTSGWLWSHKAAELTRGLLSSV